MFKLLPRLLCLSLLVWLAPFAAAAQGSGPDFVISSGKAGGNYDAVARRLATVLRSGHDFYVEVENSGGSVENLMRLGDPENPVGVALTQADALSSYLEEHPDFSEHLVVLSRVGRECVVIISRRGGGIERLADLKTSAGRKISVDRAESGVGVTWGVMKRLEPALGATEAVQVDTMEAMAQIRLAGEFSKVKAAMLVQRPRVVSPPLEIVLQNPDAFHLVPIVPGDLEGGTLPDGSPVYTFDTVKIRQIELDTLCTRGLLVASKAKLDEEKRSRLAAALLQSSEVILPGVD